MDRQIFRRAVLLGAAILLVVASTASVAQAASLCVNPKGSGGCYSSIQAAVDAASDGDQIVVRAGRYVEQVAIIDKDITLVGREGAVVQAFPGMVEILFDATGIPNRPIIGVANAEVTIRGLTIDGMNLAADNLFLDGITFINAGGVIRDNRIRNIGFGEPTLPLDPDGIPIYQGDGIFVINLGATARTINITNNRIINFNNNGMTLVSVLDPAVPGPSNLTVEVVNNTVIGMGANDVIDQWGIFLVTDTFDGSTPPVESNATGNIQGNHVQDLATVAPYPLLGSGIVMFNTTNLDISHNQVQRVNVGLDAVPVFNTQIANNDISGFGPDDSGSQGLALSGSDNHVNQNQFRKFETGILLHIQHPFFGSALNTSLNGNEFSNVSVELKTGAGAPPEMASAAPAASKLQGYRLRLNKP